MRLGSHFKEERLQGQRKVMTKMDYFYKFFFRHLGLLNLGRGTAVIN